MAQSQARTGGLKSVYERVTEQVLQKLEEGVVPWHSPHIAKIGFPRNVSVKRSPLRKEECIRVRVIKYGSYG